MFNRIKNSKAFTLVEILVAIGILAGAIATMMPMVEVSSMLSVEDQKMLQGVILANNKIVEVERDMMADIARGKFPDESSESGIFDAPFQNFSWEVNITKVEIPMQEGEASEDSNAAMMSVLKNVMKEISKAVRELKVVVRWEGREDDIEDEFSVTTHLVDIK